MGGAPISSLQLVSWPREDIGFDVLSDVIKGGADVMKSANCNIVGGHSIDDKEPKYGFSITGVIKDKIFKIMKLRMEIDFFNKTNRNWNYYNCN